MQMEYKELAVVFKALGDDTRLQIVMLLKEGELCACKILEHFQIVQSTLSHHMKILVSSGIVIGRKQGVWIHYSLNQEKVKQLEHLIVVLKGKEV